jgi:hypothetical protein
MHVIPHIRETEVSQKDFGSRPAQVKKKKISKTASQQTSQAWWCKPVNSSYMEVIGKRISV